MAAAGEPPSDELPTWFLELQELLMAAEPLEPPAPGGAQQVSSAGSSGNGPQMDGWSHITTSPVCPHRKKSWPHCGVQGGSQCAVSWMRH